MDTVADKSTNHAIPAGKFGLSVDVDRLSTYFEGWSVVDTYPGDLHSVLVAQDGSDLRLSEHRLGRFDSFDEEQDELRAKAGDFEVSFPLVEGVTADGLRYSVVEIIETSDSGESKYTAVAHVEGTAFRRAYLTVNSSVSVGGRLEGAAIQFPWLNPEKSDVKSYRTVKQLRQALKRVVNAGVVELEEILYSLDEDGCYLSSYELAEAASESVESHSVLRSVIRFFLDNPDDCDVDWGEILPLLKRGGLDYPEACTEIISLLQSEEPTYDNLLVLAGESVGEQERASLVAEAIRLTDTFFALRLVTDHKRFQDVDWPGVTSILEEKLHDPDYHHNGDLLDPLRVGLSNGWITMEAVIEYLKRWLVSPPDARAAFDIAQTLSWAFPDAVEGDEALESELNQLMREAINFASTASPDADLVIDICELLVDELGDNEAAEALRKEHEEDIAEIEKREEEAESRAQLIDNICKVALLVSVGDGKISAAEVGEASKVRPWVRAFLRAREAIETLERTGNQAKARELAGDLILIHEMSDTGMFGPPSFVQEVFDDLEDASADGVMALVKLYASKIEDSFHQRIALWTAEETAAADGLDRMEIGLLDAFAEEFGLSRKQNQKYFKGIAFPALSDQWDYFDPSEEEKSLSGMADEILSKGDDEAQALYSIMEALGISSFAELEKVTADERQDEAAVADSDQMPEIFGFMETGDWSDISAAIGRGADVNEVMNYAGIEGFHVLMVAAEQGSAEVVKELIEAGADVNAQQANLDFPKFSGSGYETPLIAALKGEQMDVFDMLLEAGAHVDPFKSEQGGWTPLTQAGHDLNLEAIKTLLQMGADPNIVTSEKRNVIKELTVMFSHHHQKDKVRTRVLKALRLCLKAGTEANKPDGDGWSAIHNAAIAGDEAVLKFFIEEARVPVDQKITGMESNLTFSTAVDLALEAGHGHLGQYLKCKGASLSAGFDAKRGRGLSTYNAYRAIFRGALKNDLEDPLFWAQAARNDGLQPSIQTVKSIIEDIIDEGFDEDLQAWAPIYFEFLAEHLEVLDNDLDALEDEDWLETLDEALDSAPDTVEGAIRAFRNRDVDLGADIE